MSITKLIFHHHQQSHHHSAPQAIIAKISPYIEVHDVVSRLLSHWLTSYIHNLRLLPSIHDKISLHPYLLHYCSIVSLYLGNFHFQSLPVISIIQSFVQWLYQFIVSYLTDIIITYYHYDVFQLQLSCSDKSWCSYGIECGHK